MKNLVFILFLLVCPSGVRAQQADNIIGHWTGTWATAMQTPTRAFMPYNNEMTERSVRQIIKVSAGGSVLRLQLSNIFSNSPVEIRSVYIAHALDSFRIDERSARYLHFNGSERVTVAAGKWVYSDAEHYDLKTDERLAITINYERAPRKPTVHMGSRTTSYIMKGVTVPQTDFARAFKYEKWFNIAALEVYAADVRTFAILGNSITDGKGSVTDHQNRWPDEMSFNLNEVYGREQQRRDGKRHEYGVLNLGIGNNRVLSVGLGEAAINRFDRDILGQHGVTDVIIFEGINDIGTAHASLSMAQRLIEAYKTMVEKCRQARLRVWLATITPMKGSGYYSVKHEICRRIVNEWVRTQRVADGYLDFDKLMRDPADEQALRPQWRLGDNLHPNAEGYKEMGRYAADFFMKQ